MGEKRNWLRTRGLKIFRWWAGSNVVVTTHRDTAPRCRSFTSPGATAPALVEIFARQVRGAGRLYDLRTGIRLDSLIVEG